MITNKITLSLYIGLFGLCAATSATAVESDENTYLKIGTEYEYSDNIYNASSDEVSGDTKSADIAVGYKKSFVTTNIALNYSAQYSDSSQDDLDDSNYWIGNSTLSQQVFSKNLILYLSHTRQRYILNQSEAPLESNTDEKDSLSEKLSWSIPYSQRTSFVLGIGHSNIWYADNDTNNYGTNSGNASWQYALDQKSKIQLSYTGSKKIFDSSDETYIEHNLGLDYSRQYSLGSYSFSIGKSWVITDDSEDYSGNDYGFSIDAQVRQHVLNFDATYSLTNTSDQIGTDNELDFSTYQIYHQTNVSLQYQYNTIDARMTSTFRLYYINDNEVNDSTSTDQDQYGLYGGLTRSLTNNLSASISYSYYEIMYSDDDNKQYTKAEISTSYNLLPSLVLQISASSEQQQYVQSSSDYQEQVYTTRLAYTY